MGEKTGIEWTDATWNPTTGCDRVSPGCDHCYAMSLAPRLKAMGSKHYQTDGDPKTSGPGFGVGMHEDALDKPLRWTRPKRTFVNSMSDLFHDEISTEFIAEVFAVMAMAQQHTFQVLTKRHGRMRSLLNNVAFCDAVVDAVTERGHFGGVVWPLRNVWLGVSVENQQWANIRIPALRETPAVVRFLSMEPLLGPVCLDAFHSKDGHAPGTDNACELWPDDIDWVIVGGESGPGARPMHPDWARSLRDQCITAEVPFLFKQWGEWSPNLDSLPDMPFAAVSHAGRLIRLGDETQLVEAFGAAPIARVGKKTAGRELDGRTWDEYPESVSV
jgi:protein gp37